MDTLVRVHGGRLIDPGTGTDSVTDLWIRGENISPPPQDPQNAKTETIDAHGCWVIPGLVDMHVHLREPGKEDAETIESGISSAFAGGVTTMACMPNTTPALDNPGIIEWVIQRAKDAGFHDLHPIGTVSVGRQGESIVDIEQMVHSGARAFSDDGSVVRTSRLLRDALQTCAPHHVPIIDHCEDMSLSRGGVIREGPTAMRLGVGGIPSYAEDVMVARDIVLSKQTGAHLHLAHLSTSGSISLLRDARSQDIPVTGEVTPHHIALTTDKITSDDGNMKMNPPLGTEGDQQAIIEGLKDGTISVIASDHAPHTTESKSAGLKTAPFGVVGLETMLPVVITYLVRTGDLDPMRAVSLLTVNPADILGIDRPSLAPGNRANVVIVDPDSSFIVDPEQFHSKSRNSCFTGMRLFGRIQRTFYRGKTVFSYQNSKNSN